MAMLYIWRRGLGMIVAWSLLLAFLRFAISTVPPRAAGSAVNHGSTPMANATEGHFPGSHNR